MRSLNFIWIKYIIEILLFVYFSYEDIRYRKISTQVLLAGYAAAAINLIFVRELAVWEYLAAGCIGVLFLFFGIAGEQIGIGDGALIMLLGIWSGVRRQVFVLFLALLFCAAAAAVLLMSGKVNKKSRLPFAPFLCTAFCISLF